MINFSKESSSDPETRLRSLIGNQVYDFTSYYLSGKEKVYVLFKPNQKFCKKLVDYILNTKNNKIENLFYEYINRNNSNPFQYTGTTLEGKEVTVNEKPDIEYMTNYLKLHNIPIPHDDTNEFQGKRVSISSKNDNAENEFLSEKNPIQSEIDQINFEYCIFKEYEYLKIINSNIKIPEETINSPHIEEKINDLFDKYNKNIFQGKGVCPDGTEIENQKESLEYKIKFLIINKIFLDGDVKKAIDQYIKDSYFNTKGVTVGGGEDNESSEDYLPPLKLSKV